MTDDDAQVAKADQTKNEKKNKKYSFLVSVQHPLSSLYNAPFVCFGWLASWTVIRFCSWFCFYGAEDDLSETSPEDAG